jgi:hypothetical protein
MRTPQELAYRLRQELLNIKLLYKPPYWKACGDIPALPGFPAPASIAALLRGTELAKPIEILADDILAHRLPLFESYIVIGPEIDWRRDYVNKKVTNTRYFRRVPYLDLARAGDHKLIWELNRHQHLVLLAQAYVLFDKKLYLEEIVRQIESWWEQNSFQRGINWVSALEVAFRALSWIWILHLAGDNLPVSFITRLRESLFVHGLHIENNLSFYFSPNTHLLGEAVALHAIGVAVPEAPFSAQWKRVGAEVAEAQMEKQVRDDGSHFEQSTYYHLYALDMLLFHAVLAKPSEQYLNKLARMADYLCALLGYDRRLPFIGDDDGGRWFFPYGKRDEFGRATLATCSAFLRRNDWTCEEADFYNQACWWLDCEPSVAAARVPASRLFPNAGAAIMQSPSSKVIVDAGPFGSGAAGHSHAGVLGVTVTVGDREILIDPGTFTYLGQERNHFRGTAAHNTVRIDGLDQADPVNPFRWMHAPWVRILQWTRNEAGGVLQAECGYRGFTHRRHVQTVNGAAVDPVALIIVDEISGPPGSHSLEQFWHFGDDSAAGLLVSLDTPELISGWRSHCYAQKQSAPVLRIRKECELPARFASVIRLRDDVQARIHDDGRRFEFSLRGRQNGEQVISFDLANIRS